MADKVVKIARSNFVIDFPVWDSVEVDLSKFAYFYLEYRLGSWYLCHYTTLEENPWYEHAYRHDFEITDFADTVLALGQKLKGYRCLHNNAEFPETLAKWLGYVIERKKP